MTTRKTPSSTRRRVSRTRTRTTSKPRTPAPDPTSDAALLALPAPYAGPPDIPVDVARRELASLARVAAACAPDLARVGIVSDVIERATAFARVLGHKQKAWQQARRGVSMSAADRKHLAEAEALDAKLVAGGRWALRRDPTALAELARIAEGSGLVDTLQDLRDLQAFWHEHAELVDQTLITAKDLARIPVLVSKLQPAAEKEVDDVAAACALDLRNRAFWAAQELAGEIREAGRYVYAHDPKLAARFASRYRTTLHRRSRKKAAARKKAARKKATEDTASPVETP